MNRSVLPGILSALVATVFNCSPVFPQVPTIPVTFDDASLSRRFDFVINVQTQVLQGYMGYAGSQLNPITQLSVSYQETGRWDPSRRGQVIKYEDLWYHNCDAIGCRRYNLFKVAPAGQGMIRFLP